MTLVHWLRNINSNNRSNRSVILFYGQRKLQASRKSQCLHAKVDFSKYITSGFFCVVARLTKFVIIRSLMNFLKFLIPMVVLCRIIHVLRYFCCGCFIKFFFLFLFVGTGSYSSKSTIINV